MKKILSLLFLICVMQGIEAMKQRERRTDNYVFLPDQRGTKNEGSRESTWLKPFISDTDKIIQKYDYDCAAIKCYKEDSDFKGKIIIEQAEGRGRYSILGGYNLDNNYLHEEYKFDPVQVTPNRKNVFLVGNVFCRTGCFDKGPHWFFWKRFLTGPYLKVSLYKEMPFSKKDKDNEKLYYHTVALKDHIFFGPGGKEYTEIQGARVGVGALIAVAVGAGAYKFMWPAVGAWCAGKK